MLLKTKNPMLLVLLRMIARLFNLFRLGKQKPNKYDTPSGLDGDFYTINMVS